MTKAETSPIEGILLIDKPKGMTSFGIVSRLRRLTQVKKIGHAGTLDPMATGVMVMLIGKNFTRKSDSFLSLNKEYLATIKLGSATDSFDAEGNVTDESDRIPTLAEVEKALANFQGEIEQIPPMFSAKKVAGKKLYVLARQGIEIERKAQKVNVSIELKSYEYPLITIGVVCSKGTYIRSLAHDIGIYLKAYGHLVELRRTRSGSFGIAECHTLETIETDHQNVQSFLKI